MARPRMGPERRDAIVRAAFQRIAGQGFEGLRLRATRDQVVREVVEASEEGWRRSLVQLVGQEAQAELVIATVKGASLRPETAGIVLAGLEELRT